MATLSAHLTGEALPAFPEARCPLHAYQAAQEALRIAQLDANAAAQALAARCPFQPGDLTSDFVGRPMVVDMVTVRQVLDWAQDPYRPCEWVLAGRKARKDGKAHANALAYRTLPVIL